VALIAKNLPAKAGDVRDSGLIPGSGRVLGGGNGNPLQYSCLKNPVDKGALQATVHGAMKSQTGQRLGVSLNILIGNYFFPGDQTQED